MFSFKKNAIATCVIASFLAGCVGSDDGENTSSESDQATAVTLTGSVGDGPIVGATVSVLDVVGNLLTSESSDASANYKVTVRAGKKSYPLRLEATGGTDIVTGDAPDFLLASYALAPADKRVNLNPFSTIISLLAEIDPNGITPESVAEARGIVLRELNFGLDTTLVPDPVSTPITAENAAHIIKSSEALGETIRRVRDSLVAIGQPITGDQVVASIGADLVDGMLDGRGEAAADPRIAALANIATAQVLVEALQNRLHVGGADATISLDNAIKISFPAITESSPTAAVRITAEMLAQMEKALHAADVALSNVDLSSAISRLGSIAANSLPQDLPSDLATDLDTSLSAALSAAAVATDAQLAEINAAIRDGWGTPGDQDPSDPSDDAPGNDAAPANPEVLYSLNADLSAPQPLSGAALNGNVHIILQPSSDWLASGVEKVVFYCCKSGSEPHVRYPEDTTAPYAIEVDLSTFSAGSVRELYADVFLADQYQPQNITVNFTITAADSGDGSNSGGSSDGDDSDGTNPNDGSGGSGLPTTPTYGAATLSWTPPTTNTDGSWLSNLGGYKIYYGTAAGAYNTVINVPGSITEYTIDSLPPATYYFVVTAYNAQGVESDQSNVASKTIQ